ncbi:hypothetical protein Tco_1353093 [Tanacetum coccineum]
MQKNCGNAIKPYLLEMMNPKRCRRHLESNILKDSTVSNTDVIHKGYEDSKVFLSVEIHRSRKSQPSESESQTTELDTCDSNTSTEPSELVSEPVVNESYIEVQPKVWSDAPIIEEYESDGDNDFSHLIRDCDYHVKLAKQVELNKQNMSKGNGRGERKPTWNNVQRAHEHGTMLTCDFQDFNVALFPYGGSKWAIITGKGKIKTGKGPNWLFDLDYLTDSMNYHYVSSENQANIHAGQQESNQNTGTKDKIDAGDSATEDEYAQDCFELPIWHPYSSTNTSASKSDNKRRGPREEEQVFLDDLAKLQRQEKEASEEAEALKKNLEQETENLVTQASAAKSSSTNIFSTVSTTAKASGTNLVNTVSIPVSTASPNEGLYISDTTNSQKDNSEIPPLEDIHQDTTDGNFTHSSYDDEGAEADFTNLETVVNQTIVATSTTEAEYVAAASCCGQVLWIQNQMLDYGFNFMNTKIYIDNESTICIVKNPVYHSKTKHIAIRHHFIRDAYEKKLIQVLKIHTNDNVADLLTKAFDVSRFQFLVVSIGMINP